MELKVKKELQKIAASLNSEISESFVKTSRCFALIESVSQPKIKIAHVLEKEKVETAVSAICDLLQRNNYEIGVIDWQKEGALFICTIPYHTTNK